MKRSRAVALSVMGLAAMAVAGCDRHPPDCPDGQSRNGSDTRCAAPSTGTGGHPGGGYVGAVSTTAGSGQADAAPEAEGPSARGGTDEAATARGGFGATGEAVGGHASAGGHAGGGGE